MIITANVEGIEEFTQDLLAEGIRQETLLLLYRNYNECEKQNQLHSSSKARRLSSVIFERQFLGQIF